MAASNKIKIALPRYGVPPIQLPLFKEIKFNEGQELQVRGVVTTLVKKTELPPAKAGGLAQQSQMTKVISPLLQTRNTSKEERDAVVPYLLN